MALQINKTFSGISVSNAYVRIENISLSGKTFGAAQVNMYANTPSDGVLSSASYGFPYDLAGDNPIKQAYDYLKTLPEFAGAADV